MCARVLAASERMADMTLWLTRAGRFGEGETLALEKNLAVIGWEEMPDLAQYPDRESLKAGIAERYPDRSPGAVTNWAGQLWTFVHQIQKGDLVALPMKSRSAIVIGEVEGPYEYRADLGEKFRHTRRVKWFPEMARTAFDQDLLYSLGAFMTVCKIERNNAEARVKAMLEGKTLQQEITDSLPTDENSPQDLEEYGRNQIRGFITKNFDGDDFARLVGGLLKAQGYTVLISEKGADGGIDILAGRGGLGFDTPRLAVQVKLKSQQADSKVVRELQGAMKDFRADQGLFVSWGGYNKVALSEGRKRFFDIRLWDDNDFIDALLSVYDKLDPELQAELPLKRVWTLVSEKQDG